MHDRARFVTHNAKSWLLATACVLSIALAPALAQAEYRLETGDTLDLAVAGVPELKQTVRIDLDGQAWFPLIGPVHVGGLTLAEVRKQLQLLYPTKMLRTSTADGRERLVVTDGDAVSVQIGEYHPIYVNGDVEHPGQQSYTPGLTVRQAIALAGGFDVMHFRMTNPFMESADLRSQHEALWIEFARNQARILRLQTELGDAAGTAWREVDTPVPTSIAAMIKDLEAAQEKLDREKFTKDQDLVREQIAQLNTEINFIVGQQGSEAADLQHDMADISRSEGLVRQGLAPVTRQSEDRHYAAQTRMRMNQNMMQQGELLKTRAELVRKLDEITEAHRAQLLKDLEDARVQLASTQTKLQSTGDKILYVGLVKSQLVRGLGSRPSVQIIRRGETLAGSEDTELRPGDTVEIALDPASAMHADAAPAPRGKPAVVTR